MAITALRLYGVAGVTVSGVEAAKAVLECRSRDLLTGRGGSGPLFLQAEDTSAWAGHLKEKVARSAESEEEEEKMEGEV
ncbi:MAG: hypothetical protein DPW18_20670 [Chloroflexi bacterium]|nr:hypothetical protein [Chloroflexi bacterium CFX2]MCQ3939433.1 hypothetical protein [Chloroflexota bacterium]